MKLTKLTKLTALLLVATTVLSVTALTSCKKQTSDPENSFDVGASITTNSNYKGNPVDWLDQRPVNSDYDPKAPHGELKLHSTENEELKKYNDMMFSEASHLSSLVYSDFYSPRKCTYLCFDPLCAHGAQVYDTCQAIFATYGDADSNNLNYPYSYLVDAYDHADAPVIYMTFRRTKSYLINGVLQERNPPYYCIERLDLSTGTRTVVADYIYEIIEKLYTYGDYVYFVTSNGDIHRVHKSGGDILKQDNSRDTAKIMDIYNNHIYYLVDERYLCRCDLDLSDSEQLMDLSDLKSNLPDEFSLGLIQGIREGYLYYLADYKVVHSDTDDFGTHTLAATNSCYRIPLNDLSAEPQCIAENMVSWNSKFTDDTLFYMPAVLEKVGLPDEFNADVKYNQFNYSNGIVYALDLNTLERTTVCEVPGMSFEIRGVAGEKDDIVILYGKPYDASSLEFAYKIVTNDNGKQEYLSKYYVARKSGAKPELWFDPSDTYTYE